MVQKREFIRKHVTLPENTSNKNFVLEIIVRWDEIFCLFGKIYFV